MSTCIPDIVETTAPALVKIYNLSNGSTGSGFIVESDGLILTNAHVVEKPKARIRVELQDGYKMEGMVEVLSKRWDLATVRIYTRDLPTMKLGKRTRAGETVIAMGSPEGLRNTITMGVVSNVSRTPEEIGLKNTDIPEFIQTDTTITFGSSGGPLVNLKGEVIGINTFSMKDSPGINFAIPVVYIKRFLMYACCKFGSNHIKRCIGIRIKKCEWNGQLVILEVRKNSPAFLAGVRPGYILTRIDDVRVKEESEVYDLLEVGMKTVAVLTLRRYSKTMEKWVRFEIEVQLTPRLNCDYQVDMDYI